VGRAPPHEERDFLIVILAAPGDPEARRLTESWAQWNAALLTSRDLSRRGWVHRPEDPDAGWAVVSGRRIRVGELRGVLVRWPAIAEWELGHIEPEERAYVAAEMTAFLRSWLDLLRRPVLNRPTAVSLSGPGWRPEAWVHEAARRGIPVRPVHRRVPVPSERPPPGDAGEAATVTVVGSRWFGEVPEALGKRALRLARASGADLLQVLFERPERSARMLSADPIPVLESPEVVDAVRVHLLEGREGAGLGAVS
jgi:hypothetical protein